MAKQGPRFMPPRRSVFVEKDKINPTIAWESYSASPDSQSRSENPIIVLHGFLGCREEMRPISEILARELKRDVYLLDLRNHGASGTKWRHDYLQLALDVQGFTRDHELENVTLVGTQMGAKTAMTLALYNQDIVSNIVAIDSSPAWKELPTCYTRWLDAYKQVLKMRLEKISWAARVMFYWDSEKELRTFLKRNLELKPDHPFVRPRIPQNILWQARDAMAEFPFKPHELNKFHGPALFLRSRNSYYIPGSEGEDAISQFFPTSHIKDLDYEGIHMATTAPEQVAQAAVEFLRNPLEYLVENQQVQPVGGKDLAWQV
ncbi:alpha/beta fold hydrolase [Aspergillus homomorphus CBS 101889]|uniref:Alpha/beta-hydrolase n=1 Tax=Aspergillus homomorphus (strain CBS 101889) TaxID=1450537 RepID=A0A395I8K3_ASPHC|nr:alpha/beta-hydrolase [Aspergillus homomorphus CBS 101889]RAL16316.1 alpha/beta-hydrolase [Aspergillus homomorphus CBS 101889]